DLETWRAMERAHGACKRFVIPACAAGIDHSASAQKASVQADGCASTRCAPRSQLGLDRGERFGVAPRDQRTLALDSATSLNLCVGRPNGPEAGDFRCFRRLR